MSFNTPDRNKSRYTFQTERDGLENIVKEDEEHVAPKVENGATKKRLTAANYLNPTKIKPEWLLSKEMKEEEKNIRESVSTSMLMNPEHDKSYKRRFY